MTAPDNRRPPRVEAVLRAFGANPARWPTAERAAVADAARTDLHTARMRQQEAALDRLLDRAPAHVAATDLVARIQSAALRTPTERVRTPWRGALAALGEAIRRALPEPVRRPALALGGAALLGVVAGSVWTPALDARSTADLLSVAFAYDFDATDFGDVE